MKVNQAVQPNPKRFPKSRRLLRHSDFERVYKRGRRHFAPHMTVFYLLRETEHEQKNLRIGFTVSKALGGAVQRNRIKPELCADVVINPKRSALVADFNLLQAEVAKAFQVMERYLEKGELN